MVNEGSNPMLKVLIAHDGSEDAQQMLDLAISLLANRETDTIVLHVIPRHVVYGKGAAVLETYDPVEERQNSTELLKDTFQKLQAAGIGPTIGTDLKVGDPADLILSAAEAQGSDMIVMGGRGLNAVKRFLMGSVSTKVAHHAHCAVLIAHQKGH
jgi:nucleotide-binding universal stress UspA family protein